MPPNGAMPPGCAMPPAGAMAPAPDSPNSLPGDTINAWCDEYCSPPAFYLNVGYLTMVHDTLHGRPVALLDNASNGVDTGNPDFAGPFTADFHDIDPRFMNGVKATIGVHWDTYALELSGFYLAQSTASRTYTTIGRLDSFFNVNGDFNNRPFGFEGNNGMWLQDDIIRTRFKSALSSGEFNFRFWPHTFGEINWLVGVRYLDLYEKVGIYAGDDDLTVKDVHGNPNPILQADFTTTAHNHILGGQLGVQWDKPLTTWLATTILVKGAWGVNFVDVDSNLTRGDGFQGPSGHHSETDFSHLYEAGFFLNVPFCDSVHVRAGYNLMWVVDITEASDALDFNLANTGGRHDPHGWTFFHGPSVEFQFLF
jgi:hypothetical protein